ncbi:cytochrome c oxidase subunit 2 [Bacillus mesophilus]|uniref:Cytochrome aa3 subunit 2 n=1 Tax=Bacillus mesophilus TaxID=1808955 RepID=A0A6M0QBQ3_9BACI|nr:cytochrome c oxidase subunit II [Bacillus mesophilus]MBM7660110.1 cytochrome c oxidase subunit 2 [Bacillus mesophilus]NEY73765.1 cytochrome B5 [Bacillus mesophilus]
MHFHKYEKIWLVFGICSLIIFLSVVGVGAFGHDHQPSGGMDTIDPEKISETPPFDQPGVRKLDDGTYEAAIVAMAFGYEPKEIKVPVGSKVVFKVTSKDVIHSFSIIDTNVNMMVVPGHITTKEHTFTEPGSYLVICNEYCGTAHHLMSTTIEVVNE